MTDEITKPGDILTLRKWDAVLFTTYALSISFFESFVVHHLRGKGLGEIWVIVDADGYQNSLMERRAWGAGRDYHLIPVRLPKGVFHCKCTYLWSEEGDVLLIGSGNATFGGFGKNLESMQVLTPDVAPSGFSAFANFLELLSRRNDFLNPDGQWVEKFSRRARNASEATGTPTNSFLQLIHSVESPILEQVCDFLESHAPIRRVTVLSPYHDPDGRAVKSLVDRLSCPEIAIGLPGNPKTPSAFAFHLVKSWKKHVSAVRPDTPNLQRHLHSKWIEFACDGGVVTLVGSVNATSQALCTTNNIEVGVLRFDANKNTLAAWKKTEVPDTFQPTEFSRSGQSKTLPVHAVLRSDGDLAGRILTASDCSGTWDALVEYSSDDHVEFRFSVGKEGYFCEPFPGNLEETLSSTLQLVLRSGEREARGWIHVAEVLGLPERDRRVLGAIGRFVRGNADEDDDIVLLEYLAASAIRHLNAFDLPLRLDFPPDSKDCHQDGEMTIDLGDLKPDPNVGQGAGATGAPEAASAYVLDKWFAQLRKRLLGRPLMAHVDFNPINYLRQPSAIDPEEDDQVERDRKVQQIGSALGNFDSHMRLLVKTPGADKRVLRIVLVMWLEVKLNMLTSRLDDPVGAGLFAREWFEKATTYSELAPDVSAVEEHIFAIAAAIPYILDVNGNPEQACVALHEDLERFCKGTVPVERAIVSGSASSAWVARALLPGADADLTTSLTRILGTRTLRQEVETVLSCMNSNLPIPEDSILFDSPEGAAFRDMLRSDMDCRNIAIVERAEDGCPVCQCLPTARVEQCLRNSRVATCSHCNHILLRTGI